MNKGFPIALRHPSLALVSAALLSAIMIAFTTLPGNSAIVTETSKALGGTDFTDAVGHVVLTGLVTAAWYGCFLQFLRPRWAIGLALLITISIGTTTELLQNAIPERGESWLDLAANWIGPLSFALWLYLRVNVIAKARRSFSKPDF